MPQKTIAAGVVGDIKPLAVLVGKRTQLYTLEINSQIGQYTDMLGHD